MEKKSHKLHSGHKSHGTGIAGHPASQASSYQTVLSTSSSHSQSNKRRHSLSSHAKFITNNNNITPGMLVASPKIQSIFHQSLQMAKQQALTVPRNKNEEAIHELRTRIPEIEKIFDIHNRIGNGTFSTVLLGTLKKERDVPESMRRKFAIKHHIPTSHPERIMKELQCMAKIGGTDNVVGINCCIRYNESVAFIMPYLQHDRFHDFYGKMDLEELQFYMKNLLIALRHVHKFNVIHRDVKPSNFLYNRRRRQFLLVDFGLAQQVHTTNNNPAIQGSAHTNVSATSGTDGKRQHEEDETVADTSAIPCEGNKSSKRLRYSGPQGDQDVSSVVSVNNRPGIRKDSTFKMPLKQINEITPGKQGSTSTTGSNETSHGRSTKSAGTISSANARSTIRNRTPTLNPNASNMTAATSTTATGQHNSSTMVPAEADTNEATNSKNIGNRTLVPTNVKCHCYGNPQVCNICLIRKEIHASRAGTPGYRPPEVLLKYPDQTTSVDIWAVGVILLSVLSSVYPFFKAPNDYVALAEMVTIFGDKTIRKTAFVLDRLVTLSQRTKPLDLRKLCVRFRNRIKFSSPELLSKYQSPDGTCEVCKNCDQFFFNCLCADSEYKTEPLDEDDPFPDSAYDLLYKLLEVNPHKRITAAEALNHPFFSEKCSKIKNANNKKDRA